MHEKLVAALITEERILILWFSLEPFPFIDGSLAIFQLFTQSFSKAFYFLSCLRDIIGQNFVYELQY